MDIRRLGITVEEQAARELATATAEHVNAITDYNIMMGNLEDPSEDDEEEE